MKELYAMDLPLGSTLRERETTLYQYLQSNTRQNVLKSLQKDLETIASWAQKWLVLYNAKKTQVMTMSRKKQEIKPI
jgi:hypothetical protein